MPGFLKEVVRPGNPVKLLWLCGSLECSLHGIARAELVRVAADEEFGLTALWQKLIGVVAVVRAHRQPEAG